jgi:hypothetical protein
MTAPVVLYYCQHGGHKLKAASASTIPIFGFCFCACVTCVPLGQSGCNPPFADHWHNMVLEVPFVCQQDVSDLLYAWYILD